MNGTWRSVFAFRYPTGRGILAAGALLLALLMLSAPSPTRAQVSPVHELKHQGLSQCPRKTVAQCVNSLLDNVRWELLTTENNEQAVNIQGVMTVKGKPVTATLQFILARKAGVFRFASLEFNGQPQSNETRDALLARMCED